MSRALFVALVLFPILPAFAEHKQTLVVGIRQFPPNLHPSIETTTAKSYVLGMTGRPITAHDKDWKLVCLLCRKLPSIANGLARLETLPDGRTGVAVTYSLHDGLTWGDGTPVTVKDVQFTWEVGRHPESGISKSSFFKGIWKIESLGEKSFTLHFDKVTFDYNDIGEFLLLPEHVERPVFENSPAQYRYRNSFDNHSTNPGLYFGPYRITKVVPGSIIVLERNSTWRGTPPTFERIVVRSIEDTAALEANLLSNDIDMIAGELGITIEQALSMEKRTGGRFNITYRPGLLYEHVDLNLDNQILKDRRVRQALMHALDRELIIEQIFGGRQTVAHSNVSPLDRVFARAVTAYDHDPDKAAALLDSAGWTIVRDGIRHNSQGEPLRLELVSTSGHRTRERIEQIIQQQWRQVGIDLRIRNETPRVLFGDTLPKRKFSGLVLYAFSTAPESVPRVTLHSEQVPSVENAWTGFNFTGFRNSQMDRLIDEIEAELDSSKRMVSWRDLQHLYAVELPALPLFFYSLPHVLPPWLEGVEPTGHEYPSTLWIENWAVRH